MSAPLLLTVLTPEGVRMSAGADMVRLPLADGSYGILKGHCHMLAELAPGRGQYRQGGVTSDFQVTRGIAEVRDDQVILVMDA